MRRLPGHGSLPRGLCRYPAPLPPLASGPWTPRSGPSSCLLPVWPARRCLLSEVRRLAQSPPGAWVTRLARLSRSSQPGRAGEPLPGQWDVLSALGPLELCVLFLQTPHARLALPVETWGVAWGRTLGLSPQSASRKVRPPQGQEEAYMAIQLMAGQTSPKPIHDHHRVPSKDMPTRTKPNPTPGGTMNRGLSLPNNSPHSPNTAQRSPPPGSLP